MTSGVFAGKMKTGMHTKSHRIYGACCATIAFAFAIQLS